MIAARTRLTGRSGAREPTSPEVVDHAATEAAAPAAIEAAQACRAALAAQLPCLAPLTIKRLQPPRYASKFDPAAAAEAMLGDPGVLVAAYAAARRAGVPATDDPTQLAATLGPSRLAETATRLMGVPQPADPAALDALLRAYRHAVAAGRVAALIGPGVGVEPRVAQAAALLHDLGRIALLASRVAAHAIRVCDHARGAALDTGYVESHLLGVSHRKLGMAVAEAAGVPESLAEVCVTHDGSAAAMRRKLPRPRGALAAVVLAADQVATAYGLAGAVSDELHPAPDDLAGGLAERRDALALIVRELTDAATTPWPQWRPPTEERPLAGVRVALATTRVGWNVFGEALRHAGAAVSAAGAGEAEGADVVVSDSVGSPIADALEALRRRGGTPTLLLADRSQEPHDRLRAAGLGVPCHATPIRPGSLVAAVRRCAGAA